jgi:hypothetical protein
MALAIPTVIILDEGIDAYIQGSPLSVLTQIEVRNRLYPQSDTNNGSDVAPGRLAESLNLTDAQVRAGPGYYNEHRAEFDEELIRRKAASEVALSALVAAYGNQNRLAEIIGTWPDDETDEQVNTALERMS